MKQVKNWKILKPLVSLSDALQVLSTQDCDGIIGTYAIKSPTDRLITKYATDLTFSSLEITLSWMIMVPDDKREAMNDEIISLAKESNATGISYNRLDHMDINSLWDDLIQYFDEKEKYKLLKYYFENKVYKK